MFYILDASGKRIDVAKFTSLVSLTTSLAGPAIKFSGFIYIALGSAGSLQAVDLALQRLEESAAKSDDACSNSGTDVSESCSEDDAIELTSWGRRSGFTQNVVSEPL